MKVRVSAAAAAVALASLGLVGSLASTAAAPAAAPVHVVQAGTAHPDWQLPPCAYPNEPRCAD